MPMFTLSIKRAEESADIMDIRLYNYGKSRTNYRTNKWTKINSLLLILNIFFNSINLLFFISKITFINMYGNIPIIA